MKNTKFNIIKPHLCYGFIYGLCRRLICFRFRCNLTDNENFFAGNSTASHAFPYACLIFISLYRINQAISNLHCISHGFRRLPIRYEPCAKSQLGNLDSIRKCICFLQYFCLHFSTSILLQAPSKNHPSFFALDLLTALHRNRRGTHIIPSVLDNPKRTEALILHNP